MKGKWESRFSWGNVVTAMCGSPEDGAATGLLAEHGAEVGVVWQTADNCGESPA